MSSDLEKNLQIHDQLTGKLRQHFYDSVQEREYSEEFKQAVVNQDWDIALKMHENVLAEELRHEEWLQYAGLCEQAAGLARSSLDGEDSLEFSVETSTGGATWQLSKDGSSIHIAYDEPRELDSHMWKELAHRKRDIFPLRQGSLESDSRFYQQCAISKNPVVFGEQLHLRETDKPIYWEARSWAMRRKVAIGRRGSNVEIAAVHSQDASEDDRLKLIGMPHRPTEDPLLLHEVINVLEASQPQLTLQP